MMRLAAVLGTRCWRICERIAVQAACAGVVEPCKLSCEVLGAPSCSMYRVGKLGLCSVVGGGSVCSLSFLMRSARAAVSMMTVYTPGRPILEPRLHSQMVDGLRYELRARVRSAADPWEV